MQEKTYIMYKNNHTKMKKLFMLPVLLLVGLMAISAQDKYSVYAVGFYNLSLIHI